jgi:hypothetical protein
MASPNRVSFKTIDGTTLKGDYFPLEKDNAPIIIMTQGVSSTINSKPQQ